MGSSEDCFWLEELGSRRALDSVVPSSLNNRGVATVDEINSRNQRMLT
jgi:hypothetical protein